MWWSPTCWYLGWIQIRLVLGRMPRHGTDALRFISRVPPDVWKTQAAGVARELVSPWSPGGGRVACASFRGLVWPANSASVAFPLSSRGAPRTPPGSRTPTPSPAPSLSHRTHHGSSQSRAVCGPDTRAQGRARAFSISAFRQLAGARTRTVSDSQNE